MSKHNGIDQEKAKEALKAAGIVIPDSPDVHKRISEALKKAGIRDDLTFIANGNYVLVVPD